MYGGDRYPFHGHFVPGDGNAIGFEDVVTIEDYAFLDSVARGEQHHPGLDEALAYVAFQAAWLRSCESGRWEDVTALEVRAVKTIRYTTAQAIVRYLIAQQIDIDGSAAAAVPRRLRHLRPRQRDVPRPGAGGGRATCFPTWRGQNEQGMALAAVAFAKASRRRRIMVATSSIGPGATNMITAAAVAHANRLPVLLLAGDTFACRIPDPVLQQIEGFGDPSVTVNDAFKPVTRFWDRIVRPEQVAHSLPHAVATMLDPATCGPAFLALPAGRAGRGLRLPGAAVRDDRPRDRPAATGRRSAGARRAGARRGAERPLIIAGGGVHYSFAEAALAAFAERHNIPVVETVAGKASLLATHPLNAGPIGVTGCTSANALAAEADVVLAVGTRLQDFTTGSWTLFRDEHVRFIGLNTAGYDAVKHLALPLVADAREGLAELSTGLGGWRGTGRLGRAGGRGDGAVPPLHRQDRQSRRHVAGRAADLRPGDRRHRPAGASRPTTPCRPPAASPASSTTAGGRRR